MVCIKYPAFVTASSVFFNKPFLPQWAIQLVELAEFVIWSQGAVILPYMEFSSTIMLATWFLQVPPRSDFKRLVLSMRLW
jgi:hypothetical protein